MMIQNIRKQGTSCMVAIKYIESVTVIILLYSYLSAKGIMNHIRTNYYSPCLVMSIISSFIFKKMSKITKYYRATYPEILLS